VHEVRGAVEMDPGSGETFVLIATTSQPISRGSSDSMSWTRQSACACEAYQKPGAVNGLMTITMGAIGKPDSLGRPVAVSQLYRCDCVQL